MHYLSLHTLKFALFFFYFSLLVLEDVMCPTLSPPTNGSVDFEAQGVGSKARYSCIEGFVLEGPQSRSCQTNGAWSGREPTCEREQA